MPDDGAADGFRWLGFRFGRGAAMAPLVVAVMDANWANEDGECGCDGWWCGEPR